VHRRPWMGHGDVVRHHCAADQRRHNDRRRGRGRRRALVQRAAG
jgi:hypothetical protein